MLEWVDILLTHQIPGRKPIFFNNLYRLFYTSQVCILTVLNNATRKQMDHKSKFSIGEEVCVKCPGSDVWAKGEVIGFTQKMIRVINHGRMGSDGQCYRPHHVKKI